MAVSLVTSPSLETMVIVFVPSFFSFGDVDFFHAGQFGNQSR
jgi:hypothetical protein